MVTWLFLCLKSLNANCFTSHGFSSPFSLRRYNTNFDLSYFNFIDHLCNFPFNSVNE